MTQIQIDNLMKIMGSSIVEKLELNNKKLLKKIKKLKKSKKKIKITIKV